MSKATLAGLARAAEDDGSTDRRLQLMLVSGAAN
jgi:hypothetical protein